MKRNNKTKAFAEMTKAFKEEALQNAKVDIFRELIDRNDKLVKLGIVKKMDDSIMNDLRGDLSKAIQAAKRAKLDAIKLSQKAELAEIASYSGCSHPDLLAESLMENVNIDDTGKVYFCESDSKLPLRDSKTGKPMDSVDLVKEMASRAIYAPLFGVYGAVVDETPSKFVQPSTAQRNPWLKSDFNLTQQARIMAENPELAEAMKEAANPKKW